MTSEFSSSQRTISAPIKCDLDQLFRTRMTKLEASKKLLTNGDNTDHLTLRDVMATLNETANGYLSENSAHKQLASLNEQYVAKCETLFIDLERDLNAILKKKYAKHCSLDASGSHFDCSTMKANVRDYLNCVAIQMHNELW